MNAAVSCAGSATLKCAANICVRVVLRRAKKKGTLRDLEHHRVLYDSVALLLATLPVVFVLPTIVTGPMAVFVALRYWKVPSSIIGRTKVRHILALLLGGIQMAGWVMVVGLLLS